MEAKNDVFLKLLTYIFSEKYQNLINFKKM